MAKVFEGSKGGSGLKIAIAVSRFNESITQRLLASARDALIAHGVSEKNIDVAWVPGAFELPRAVQALLEREEYDGILPLGCVIRGETPHFEYICQSVTSGITMLSLDADAPVVFGILTTETEEQAMARAGDLGNKGKEAAEALLELINLLRTIRRA